MLVASDIPLVAETSCIVLQIKRVNLQTVQTWRSDPGDMITLRNIKIKPTQFRSPGESDSNYVSVVSNDDFAQFQQNGFHGEDEEDIDFSPQNGYVQPEDERAPSKGKYVIRKFKQARMCSYLPKGKCEAKEAQCCTMKHRAVL